MRTGARRLLVALLLPLLILAAGDARAGDERVSRVHPLGMAEREGAYELINGLLSGAGRAVLDEGHNAVIVLDVPAVQERVAVLLTGLQEPLPNVRVEARIVDARTGESASVSTTGQLLLAFPERSAGGEVYFHVDGKGNRNSRKAQQEILVISGGSAVITVGREIPYQNWFYSYGRRQGFIAGEVQWRKVASSLAVSPVVVGGGQSIRLKVTPQFEYLAGAGRGKKKRRSTISFAGAATEIVVANGVEERIGGSGETEEFYDRFLTGYDRQRRTRNVDIYLRATIVTDDSRGASSP